MIKRCGAFAVRRAFAITPSMLLPQRFRCTTQQHHGQRCFTCFMSAKESAEGKDLVPMWEYRGYKNPPPLSAQRRRFTTDNWIVPNNVTIPEDRIELSFVKSSGPGGQSVNKSNSKVELRFCLDEAHDWLPKEVCERIKEQQPSRVSKEGIFSLSSQERRTQIGNRKDAFAKLKSIILSAWPRPKIRKIRTGVSVEAKEKNKDNKRMISGKKANRKGVDF